MNTSEFVCYFGSLTALVIAYKLFRIEHLTFPNKMMVFFYSLDSMLGLLEAYFAFKLLRERYKDIKSVSVYKVQKVRQGKTWTRHGQDGDKTGTRQEQDRDDKTGKSQGQDKENTGTR